MRQIGSPATITVLGIESVGRVVTQNWLAAGNRLRVWDRSGGRAAVMAGQGAIVCRSPAEAVTGADLVVTALPGGRDCGEILRHADVAAALRPRAFWLDLSAGTPHEAREQFAWLEARGHGHLDGVLLEPVSVDGTCRILLGGRSRDVASVQPLLSAIGAPVHLGPAGTAQMARLARTMLDAAMTAAIAEAVMMLERADLPDSRQSVALGLGGTLWSSMPSSMQTGEAGPGFAVRNLVADLYDVLQAAHRDGLTLSLAQHLHDRYAYLSEALGHGERDRAAILREVINRNGLGPMGDIE